MTSLSGFSSFCNAVRTLSPPTPLPLLLPWLLRALAENKPDSFWARPGEAGSAPLFEELEDLSPTV